MILCKKLILSYCIVCISVFRRLQVVNRREQCCAANSEQCYVANSEQCCVAKCCVANSEQCYVANCEHLLCCKQ